MALLCSRPAHPRSLHALPRYPRAILAAGLVLNVAGCMGAAPDAYQSTHPPSTSTAQPTSTATAPTNSIARPPDDDPVQVAGEPPAPFEP